MNIDWEKPIYANFGDGSSIKCFIVGQDKNTGNWWVGVPDPDEDQKGIMVQIKFDGSTVSEGLALISNFDSYLEKSSE